MAWTLTLIVVAVIVASGWHAPASAHQTYRSRPIRMIVPFTTGGGVDIVARAIAQRMSEYDLASWNGILAPASVSAGIVARLNAEIGKALDTADVKTRVAADGAEPAASSPAEFAVYIRSEVAKFAKLIAAAGIPKE